MLKTGKILKQSLSKYTFRFTVCEKEVQECHHSVVCLLIGTQVDKYYFPYQ